LKLNYNTKMMAVGLVLLVVLLEVMLTTLVLQSEVGGLRRMVVLFLAVTLAASMPVAFHFELPRFNDPKFKLSLTDFLMGVFGRSMLLGVAGIALSGLVMIGLFLVLVAQLALTSYSVYLVVWKMK
jgi:hypothetical protein